MDILKIDQAVVEIPRAIKRFRVERADAEPVVVGEGGRPEAVVLSFPMFERMTSPVEDLEIARIVRERTAAGPATPLSRNHDETKDRVRAAVNLTSRSSITNAL